MHSVLVNLSPERVTEGYYELEDGVLTMVFADGAPVLLPDNSTVTHTMRPGDDAQAIARVLTRNIRSKLRGDKVPGFSDDLAYPDMGYA